jgi:hypothetical protein
VGWNDLLLTCNGTLRMAKRHGIASITGEFVMNSRPCRTFAIRDSNHGNFIFFRKNWVIFCNLGLVQAAEGEISWWVHLKFP